MEGVEVWNMPGGILVGVGHIYSSEDGDMTHPILYDFDGRPLPEGWYTLRLTGDRRTIVIPWRTQ